MIAIVQRPRRKAHLASNNADAAVFVTVCDRDVPAAGTQVLELVDVVQWIDDAADHVCVHCQRIILMAGLVATAWRLEDGMRPAAIYAMPRFRPGRNLL